MSGDRRAQRRQRTRASIQEAALRLFEEQGYEATTVAQIAEAAGVSHMTFFRHFPSKEEVVLADEYDPMLEELVRAQPDHIPAVERIHRATLIGLGRVYESNREALLHRARLLLSIPALRSRIGENLASSSTAFERGLSSGEPSLEVRAVAAACSAALSTAVIAWAEGDGEQELPELVDEAFRLLSGATRPRDHH
ncbi:TetR/AcrR family transcriptional regulator [Nocardiopsis algeriensis]|uniref:TetR/AcrR family transcriptional regulator n=1 Tax=Nocardiopsis algeriensis TaxID=1478215 RepID=UPI003B43792B